MYNPLTGLYDSNEPKPIPRYPTIYQFGVQFHLHLGKSMGLYTGIWVRKIGMIYRLNDTIKFKHRLYALVVPFGIKLGDMQKRVFAVLGAELELFFN